MNQDHREETTFTISERGIQTDVKDFVIADDQRHDDVDVHGDEEEGDDIADD